MNAKKDQKIEYSSYSSYIRQFWVGLMDGDGSLQVNHWRKQSLQYRLVIQLKNDPDKYNYILLQRIRKSIGGDVRIVSSSRFVIWVENHKSKISQIVKIFDKYPPYTKRLYDQYLFYLESVKINNVDWYLENRDKKYQTKQYIIAMTRTNPSGVRSGVTSVIDKTPLNTLLETPLKAKRWGKAEWSKSITPQSTQSAKSAQNAQSAQSGDTLDAKKHNEEQSFKGWLSGFIEAEGCFTLRNDSSKEEKVCSFSISQKGEPLLLERINMFFGGQTKVRKVLLKKQKHLTSLTPPEVNKSEICQSAYTADIANNIMTDKSKICYPKVVLGGNVRCLQCWQITTLTSDITKGNVKSDVTKVVLRGDVKRDLYIDKKKDQKDHFYILEIYRKTVLEKVLSHCTAYPLYGEKQKSFNLFKKTFI